MSDGSTHDSTRGDAPAGAAPSSGGPCPLCDEVLPDRHAFRDHLAAAHDLHDEEGAETDFVPPLLPPLDPPPGARPATASDRGELPPAAAAAIATAHRRAVPPPPGRARRRRRGAVALVLASVVALAVVIGVASETGTEPDRQVATGAGTGLALPGTLDSTPTSEAATAPAEALAEPSVPAPADAAGEGEVAAALPGGPSVPPQPVAPPTQPIATNPAPAPTTSPPPTDPAPFSPPAATGAQRDSCTKRGSTWLVAYSWTFSGGAGWSPAPAYAPLGGGRYRAEQALPRSQPGTITQVVVLDSAGGSHPVALDAPITTAGC